MKLTLAFALLLGVLAVISAAPQRTKKEEKEEKSGGRKGGSSGGSSSGFASNSGGSSSGFASSSSGSRTRNGPMRRQDNKSTCRMLLKPKDIIDECEQEGSRPSRRDMMCMKGKILDIVNDGSDNIDLNMLVDFIKDTIDNNEQMLLEEGGEEIPEGDIEALKSDIETRVPECIGDAEDVDDAFKKLKTCIKDSCKEVFDE